MTETSRRRFRSQDWFDNPDHLDMTAIYLERFMNYGMTPEELRSGRPIIGIAQTGSDLNPCNRIHVDLARRVRDGIRDAGGVPIEFPVHPTFENCKRPTAALDRNLAYLGLVELLYGYPIDAVVLMTGCDKSTPACLMAAATVDIPAIVLSGGPMLDGWHDGKLVGSGTVIWAARKALAAGEIDADEFLQRATDSAPSLGHCNTMGTALTMNSMAEALGNKEFQLNENNQPVEDPERARFIIEKLYDGSVNNLRQLGLGDRGCEPLDGIVAGVDLHDQRGPGA
jgi:dihydroxy-acid dehydratase